MNQLTPISPDKRNHSISKHAMDTASSCDTHATKRRRLSPSSLKHSSAELDAPDLVSSPITPPNSSPGHPTMALKLTIPYKEPTKGEQRTLAIRKASAHRWQSKLQRPFPSQSEIKQAYNLKLMRQYPNTRTTNEPNFVRPRIDSSPRVDQLLRHFPLQTARTWKSVIGQQGLSNPVYSIHNFQALSSRAHNLREAEASNVSLQINKTITESDYVQRLAWRNFATKERNRIDRGREAMLQSGLRTDDLDMEAQGQKNKLPEWKKLYTGKFSRKLTGNNAAGG